MNLSDFSLLKEDSDSYHIGHPNGKSMKVDKKGMSAKAHEAIQKLSSGGDVEPMTINVGTPQFDPSLINPSPGSLSAQNGITKSTAAPDQYGVDPEEYAKMQEAAKVQSSPEFSREPAAAPSPTPTQAPAQSDPLAQESGSINQALSTEKSAIQKGAAAEANAGAASSKAYQNYADQQQLMPTPDDIFQAHQAKDQKLSDAFQSKTLDPDRYIHNMGTGSRIASAIGMILSGLGSGLTGQPNLAVEHLNKAIENDIDAQKNDQSKAMNLWKMNREATHDEQQANLATQNQLLNVVKAKVLQAGATAQGPMAQARAAQLISDIDQKKAANNFRRSMLDQSAQGGFSNQDPAQMVPFLVQNPEQQKQVYEEIGRAQNVSKNSQKLLDTFDQAAQDNTVLKTGAGLLRTPGSVMALHQLMLPNFKQVDGTVRQAAMDETFHNLTPSPGDTDAKIAQKKQALRDWMHSETAAPIAKGNGIDLQRFRSTSANPVASMNPQQQQFLSWAKANPKDPRAALVLKKLGVQ